MEEGRDCFWLVTFVYGSPSVSCRRLLWNSLLSIGVELKVRWVVMGDFDAVLFMEERSVGYWVKGIRIGLSFVMLMS